MSAIFYRALNAGSRSVPQWRGGHLWIKVRFKDFFLIPLCAMDKELAQARTLPRISYTVSLRCFLIVPFLSFSPSLLLSSNFPSFPSFPSCKRNLVSLLSSLLSTRDACLSVSNAHAGEEWNLRRRKRNATWNWKRGETLELLRCRVRFCSHWSPNKLYTHWRLEWRATPRLRDNFY